MKTLADLNRKTSLQVFNMEMSIEEATDIIREMIDFRVSVANLAEEGSFPTLDKERNVRDLVALKTARDLMEELEDL